jgi:hypothetical protein
VLLAKVFSNVVLPFVAQKVVRSRLRKVLQKLCKLAVLVAHKLVALRCSQVKLLAQFLPALKKQRIAVVK